ncbi:GNAT family N-acetyltransferase [Micromonospora sp. NBC_01813]|uniref:GNAT family N-acetyltransferase n=1 Tax=Micromonospora sp. NBC_01813 TaxID=2975988 RepID=UPI002DD84026|nr:GNAT family N-acetyltransferase [Micromonospora sp. NBC_01813]WSA11128.1 GNAT family N-acetyltransferase [Micromonospora sp. NBC_01813]
MTSVSLPGGVLLRPMVVGDAAALLDAYLSSREHLRPFEPVRPASFWTLAGQQARLDTMVAETAQGRQLACVMLRDGRVLGCATLNTIVRGPFCSADLGYWVVHSEVGRGLASAAAAALCRIADQEMGLHRIQASTNPDNLASQRVLAKNGFEQFGTARNYLHINGRWRDAHLFQRILNDRPPDGR